MYHLMSALLYVFLIITKLSMIFFSSLKYSNNPFGAILARCIFTFHKQVSISASRSSWSRGTLACKRVCVPLLIIINHVVDRKTNLQQFRQTRRCLQAAFRTQSCINRCRWQRPGGSNTKTSD